MLLVKNNAGVLGASRVSHGVIAGELLVGVRAGVRVAEEEEIRGHAQRHERVGKDDDGGVAGGGEDEADTAGESNFFLFHN